MYVSGPHLATNRSTLIIDYSAHNYLFEIGTVVLAEASLSEILPAFALKVN
jgi:hypothetical protein